MFDIEPAQERLPAAVHLVGSAAGQEVHGQTGLGARSCGRCSTVSLMRVPSMTGSSPWWPAQAPRAFSLGCMRCQARASAAPYREVCVVVCTSGPGQRRHLRA